MRLPKEPARGRMYEKAKPARMGRVIRRLTAKPYDDGEWYSIIDLVFGTVVHRSRESFEVLADAS